VLMYRQEMDGLIVANNNNGGIMYMGHFKEKIDYEKIKKELRAGYREEVIDEKRKDGVNGLLDDNLSDEQFEDVE